MFKKNYEIIQNAPAPISWDEYSRSSYDEYQLLLQKCGNDESAFQHFLERNPSFVPGAFELFGTSGLSCANQMKSGIRVKRPPLSWG